MKRFTILLADRPVTELKINSSEKLAVKCNWLCVCSIRQLANVKIWNVSKNDDKWQGTAVDRGADQTWDEPFWGAAVNVTECLFRSRTECPELTGACSDMSVCKHHNEECKAFYILQPPSHLHCGPPPFKRVTASVHGADPGAVCRFQLHLLLLILTDGQVLCCLF